MDSTTPRYGVPTGLRPTTVGRKKERSCDPDFQFHSREPACIEREALSVRTDLGGVEGVVDVGDELLGVLWTDGCDLGEDSLP